MPNIGSKTVPAKRPFLSVVMRTQGKRLESFKDALLCLASQTDQDFEVVVVEHAKKISPKILKIIDSQPSFMREKISAIYL